MNDDARQELEQFHRSHETVVLTIFFNDLVGSTKLQTELGNLRSRWPAEAWHSLLIGRAERHPRLAAKCRTSNIQRRRQDRTSNIGHRTSNTQARTEHPTSDIEHPMPKTGPNVQHRTSNIQRRSQTTAATPQTLIS
ncbi:MAG: hypothetical protein ACYC4U_18620 [Pirellulaceae bacterium]